MDLPLEKLELRLIEKRLKKLNILNEPYLEVGCGDGFNLERFSKLNMRGTAIDLSKEATQAVNSKHFKNVEVINGDFLKFQFPNKPRIIFMLNVLEHVPNDSDFIKSAARTLDPGGYLVISLPANMKAYGFADKNAGHLRRYEKKELMEKLTRNGFEIDTWYIAGFPVNRFYTWFFNFLNRKKLGTVNEEKTLSSGIRHYEGYYPGKFDLIAKLVYPILSVIILIDLLFLNSKWGNNFVVFARKK